MAIPASVLTNTILLEEYEGVDSYNMLSVFKKGLEGENRKSVVIHLMGWCKGYLRMGDENIVETINNSNEEIRDYMIWKKISKSPEKCLI